MGTIPSVDLYRPVPYATTFLLFLVFARFFLDSSFHLLRERALHEASACVLWATAAVLVNRMGILGLPGEAQAFCALVATGLVQHLHCLLAAGAALHHVGPQGTGRAALEGVTALEVCSALPALLLLVLVGARLLAPIDIADPLAQSLLTAAQRRAAQEDEEQPGPDAVFGHWRKRKTPRSWSRCVGISLRYVWPSGSPLLQLRIAGVFAIIVAVRFVNVLVPYTYKVRGRACAASASPR